jgi:para-nitrobenzyl esterase
LILFGCSKGDDNNNPLPISTLVETSEGLVQGAYEGNHVVFKGIPYAAAPVGNLRWMPPQEPPKHAGILDALVFCPACPQPKYPGITTTSEDCLFLNIWAPSTPGPHPVLFWMHGGAFVQNSGAQSTYAGSALADRGVVVVTINYRLGALGIFAHPALTAEHPQGPLGNFVLMDQLAALRWVKKNISAFGGDPGSVTVSGSSAGATSILFLMSAKEEANGLFQKAILQSGGGIDEVFSLLQEEQAGAAFAQLLGVPADAATSTAQALRSLSASAITNANGSWTATSTPALAKKPVVDNVLIHQTVNETFVPGGAFLTPVAFMIGSADGESGGKTQPQGVPKTSIIPGGAFITDLDRAKAVVATGAKTYVYYFCFVPNNPGDVADHGESVPYSFGTSNSGNAEAVRISSLMMDYWVSFMKTGVPASSSGPTWPAYDPSNPKAMLFANPQEGDVGALPIQQ